MVSNSNGVDCVAAAKFVEALSEMSCDVWLNAARVDHEAMSVRPGALDIVASSARRLRLRLILWNIADDIETVAWYVLPRNCRAPRTRADADTRARAIEEARIAASAVLLRRHLTRAQFDALYSSFWPAGAHDGEGQLPKRHRQSSRKLYASW